MENRVIGENLGRVQLEFKSIVWPDYFNTISQQRIGSV